MNNDTVLFENWTDNNFTLSGSDENIYHISVVSHIINGVFALLTITFNSFILYCLRTHRAKISDVIYKQTLCVSVTDLLAGLAPALYFLTLFETIYRSAYACVIILTAFSAAQFAVLLNLCFLSIRRWIILRKATQQQMSNASQNSKSSKLGVIAPWLISILCHLPPILLRLIYSERSSANGCVSPNLFENRKRMIIVCGLNTGILFLLTIFYISSMVVLKRLENRNNFQSRRQRLHRKAFKHLFAVLLVANVTILPLIVLFVLANSNMDRDPHRIFFLFQLPALNSLVNPVLYSTQISEIQRAVRENLTSLMQRFQCLFKRSNTAEPVDNPSQIGHL